MAPSDPREAGPADFPMVVAGRTSSKMEERAQIHLDHSKDLLLYQDLHSSFLGPADHSTSPHGCSKEGKAVVAGLDQKEAAGWGSRGSYAEGHTRQALWGVYLRDH